MTSDAGDTAAAIAGIATLDARYHFCEAFEVSGPVDAVQGVPARGPLAGQWIGVKSNIRAAGHAWTGGIGARSSRIAETDAPCVATLRRAGARVLCRLLMDEGALGAASDNPHFGRCENPAAPGHSAGGSSGGSAAAVAAGAVHAALGSDTMGSVRIPAAYCGVYGLKFTPSLVGMDGVMPLAPSLDALGLLARTPEEIARVLSVLAPGLPAIRCPGRLMAPNLSDLPDCAPTVRAAYTAAARAMVEILGAVAEPPCFDFAALRADAFLLTEVEAAGSLGDEPGLSPGLSRLIAYGRGLSAARVNEVLARLDEAGRHLREAVGEDCVLLLPTVAEPAFRHGARPPSGQADFTALANVAGCPALAVPVPGDAGDLPVSVQLVGPPGSERTLLALAAKLRAALRA